MNQPVNALTVQYNWKNPEGKDELINLDADTVRRYIATGGNPTDQEIYDFIQLCKYMRYNPIIKEAYLVKYGTQAANIIVSKDLFAKRAEPHPMYAGYTMTDNYEELKPRLMKGDHQAIWELEVKVDMWRKDRKFPNTVVVDYIEYVGTKYDQKTGKRVPNSMWSFPGGKPRTMLRKVGLAQAYRATFPNLLTGYVSEELDKEHDDNMEIPIPQSEVKVTDVVKEEKKADKPKIKEKEKKEKINKTTGEVTEESDEAEKLPETEQEKRERIKKNFNSSVESLKKIDPTKDEPLMDGDVGWEQEQEKKRKEASKRSYTKERAPDIVSVEDLEDISEEDLEIDEGVDEYMYELTEGQWKRLESIAKSQYLPAPKAKIFKERMEKAEFNLAEYKKIVLWYWGSKKKGIVGYREKAQRGLV